MEYKFARIDLQQTNYSLLQNAKLLVDIDVDQMQMIYKVYCRYKKFSSVMPLFESEFYNNDIIGYFDSNELVAWSMIGVYDKHNIENYQFAWNYNNPASRLGINSLYHECAYYKQNGYRYYYIGANESYKSDIEGYEELGPI